MTPRHLCARSLAMVLAGAPPALQAGLEWASDDGVWQFRLEPSIQAVVWAGDFPPPALVEYTGDGLFAPRLEVALDELEPGLVGGRLELVQLLLLAHGCHLAGSDSPSKISHRQP